MTTQKPKVSILMNCHNSDTYLKEAIDSIYSQSFQDFEIIFIDNVSTDRSAEIAQSYDQRLKYHKTPRFLTLYGGRDFGLKFVNGDFLAFLDCDDVWRSEKLEHQLKLIAEKKMDFVYGAFDIIYQDMSMSVRLLFKHTLFQLKKMFKPSQFKTLEQVMQNYDINLQTVLLKTSLIKDVRFNDKLNLLGDLVFFYELALKNKMRFYYDRKVVCSYRVHAAQLSHKKIADWFKEVRYCSMFVFQPIMNVQQKQMFNHLYLHFKSNYRWSRQEYEKSMQLKDQIKCVNISFFKDWVKHLLRYKKCS